MPNGPKDWSLTPSSYRILIVDDDPVARRIAGAALSEAGFEVWMADSGPQALEILDTRGLPHVALLDMKMPEMGGLELSDRLQELVDLPIIMMTVVTDTQTIVETIRSVAEDYITKPFQPEELVARVERLLRRIGDFSYALEPRIRVDDRLELEFARRLAVVDGQPVDLTPTENKLLYILMRSAGHTVMTEYLIQRLWPLEHVVEDALRTHVYRLRKKIERFPRSPRYVVTKRGLGYSFPAHQATA